MEIDGFKVINHEGRVSVVQGRNTLMYEVLKDRYVKSIGGILQGVELEHQEIIEGSGISQHFKVVAGEDILHSHEAMDFIYNAHTALFKAGYLTYQIK